MATHLLITALVAPSWNYEKVSTRASCGLCPKCALVQTTTVVMYCSSLAQSLIWRGTISQTLLRLSQRNLASKLQSAWARTLSVRHTLVPLVWELGRVVGEPHGGWVHWGATTQNITQTGDLLVLRQAHAIILRQIGEVLSAMADLAERTADMPMAGRTHGQHAVPATFGYKVAVWIDELLRHVERLHQAAPRLFVAMLGGGAGT